MSSTVVSASTRDRAALASLVAVSPIFVSSADGKELELLKYLRRAMSILTPSAACELERYTWIKYGGAPVRIKCEVEISAILNYAIVHQLAFFAFVCIPQSFLAIRYIYIQWDLA